MKSFLAFALVVFATVTSLLAQAEKMPTVQDVPTLQEWWRADNLGYGINGMTWIDNFYNGKGALVISTPKGVQTWQLRFPWDTVNVFTWNGGDANIKTGDFDGNGTTDYVDMKGNIYEGIANGQPPKSIPVSIGYGDIIGDFNNDGYDDIFRLDTRGILTSEVGHSRFGASKIEAIKSVMIKRNPPFDTVWNTMTAYVTPSKELRLIFRLGKEKSLQDGYRLFSLRCAQGDTTIIVEKLKDNIVNTEYNKILTRSSSAIEQYDGKTYFLAIERINGEFDKTNLVIYNMSNDTFNKISEIRMDGIEGIYGLTHSINKDSVPDWFVQHPTASTSENFDIFSGNVRQGVDSLLRVQSCINSSLITLKQDSTTLFGYIGGYKDPWTNKYISCLMLAKIRDSITGVVEDNNEQRNSIESLSPMPLQLGSTLHIKYRVIRPGNYFLNLYSIEGRKLSVVELKDIESGEHTANIDLSKITGRGTFLIKLTGSTDIAQCIIIVE